MPRAARKKSPDAIYHVMSRSISEVDLFPSDEDKDRYLKLLKRYVAKYKCRIYAYCLMTNHAHLYINPQGFDISKFMLSLNTAYVTYYNKRYKRHGHLYQGRFTSKIVNNDKYGLTLSAYIHNNIKDLAGYKGKEEQYRYSSYGIYTGCRDDIDEIVDADFILGMFSSDKKKAQQKYRMFTESLRNTSITSEVEEDIARAYAENIYMSGKHHIMRYGSPEELIKKVGELLDERLPEALRSKYSRESGKIRAFVTYVMRALCGYSYAGICQYLGNMSVSGVSRLSAEGYHLLSRHPRYQRVFNLLI